MLHLLLGGLCGLGLIGIDLPGLIREGTQLRGEHGGIADAMFLLFLDRRDFLSSLGLLGIE